MLQTQLAKTATPDLAMAVGELSDALGETARAAQYYQMAEQIERGAWGNGSRQPQVLARLLAERPGRAAEAVGLAEEAARGRADILTMDTLAWAYFKNGQLPEAQRASTQAIAHRHAQRPHPVSCGGDCSCGLKAGAYFAWTRRHSSLP